MIDYRFLSKAEEEMSEAALFYEAASVGLGTDFLDDVAHVGQGIGSLALTANDDLVLVAGGIVGTLIYGSNSL